LYGLLFGGAGGRELRLEIRMDACAPLLFPIINARPVAVNLIPSLSREPFI
jgi:hypothetical protein